MPAGGRACGGLQALQVGGSLLARHELERRGSPFWARDPVDGVGGVAVVFRAVGRVELVVDVVRLDEADVAVDAAGVDVAFVPVLDAAEPGGPAPVDRAD